MNLQKDHILGFERRYRANFINTLCGFRSASLIGTKSLAGKENLAVFNSVIHIGANPPLMGFILRPVTVPRHTYNNLRQTEYFTVNHISEKIYRQSHETSGKYPADVSEFKVTGLTPEYSGGKIMAPYVKEAVVKIGLRFVEEHTITANDTILVVGAVEEVILPDDVVSPTGHIDLEKAGTTAISGLDGYHLTFLLDRLAHVSTEKITQAL